MKLFVSSTLFLGSLVTSETQAAKPVEATRSCGDGSVVQYQAGNWYLNSVKLTRQPIPFAIFHGFNSYSAGSMIHTDGSGRFYLLSSHAQNSVVAVYDSSSSVVQHTLTCY